MENQSSSSSSSTSSSSSSSSSTTTTTTTTAPTLIKLCDLSTHEFTKPLKAINNNDNHTQFKKSNIYNEIIIFIQMCADASVSIRCDDNYDTNENVTKIITFMNKLHDIIDEIPPIKQPMRFGNKAFRQWHERLSYEVPLFLNDLLGEDLVNRGAIDEIGPYLLTSFGNETRIDYGTGHELSIILFYLIIYKLKLIERSDLRHLVLGGFTSYIRTMRRLQETYVLEPAGSHGVWGLDDYHCINFLWGAAQLCNNKDEIKPSSIHDNDLLISEASNYIYLEAILFIKKIKSAAPFSETSPMLNDISALGDWIKVTAGLLRLFQGEVLGKLPVVQHVVFGSIIKAEWEFTMIPTSINNNNLDTMNSNIFSSMPTTGIPFNPASSFQCKFPGR